YLLPIPDALAPPPRERHVAAAMSGRMFVFGGRGHPDLARDGGPFMNDLWVLDVAARSVHGQTHLYVGNVTGVSGSMSAGARIIDAACSATLNDTCGVPDGNALLLPVRVPAAEDGDQQCVADVEVLLDMVHPCLKELHVGLLGPTARDLHNVDLLGDAFGAAWSGAPTLVGSVVGEDNVVRPDAALSAEQQATKQLLQQLSTHECVLFEGGAGEGTASAAYQCTMDNVDAVTQLASAFPRTLAIFNDSSPTSLSRCCPLTSTTDAVSGRADAADPEDTLCATWRGQALLPARPNTDASLLRGRFRPRDRLSAFRRLSAEGVWALRLIDRRAGAYRGYVRSWALRVNTLPCAPRYSWTRLTPSVRGGDAQPAARADAVAAELEGRWYIWGGRGSSAASAKLLTDAWRYDPVANEWARVPAAPGPGNRVGRLFDFTRPQPAFVGAAVISSPLGLTWLGGLRPATWAPPVTLGALTAGVAPATLNNASSNSAASLSAACQWSALRLRTWSSALHAFLQLESVLSRDAAVQMNAPAGCTAPPSRMYAAATFMPPSAAASDSSLLGSLSQNRNELSGTVGTVYVYGGADAGSGAILDELWALPLHNARGTRFNAAD
ncbi:hypothetical protein EON68_00115, partial [archaeon]